MKKTINANVSGTVFTFEEDAYEQLQAYLASVRAQLEGNAGRDEIMADVESRIAELITERLAGKRQVVATTDVDQVIVVMGRPEEYGDGSSGAANSSSSQSSGQRGYKRLFRDPEDKWVGGVIGGLAAYIGMDPLWLRISMIIFFLLGSGTPILLYILLWILVPKAETAADRLRMGGEPVTVDNLKRAFEEGGKKVADDVNDMGRRWNKEARRRGNEAGNVLAKVLGFGIVILGFSMLLGLVSSVAGGAFGLWQATWGTDEMSTMDLAALVFPSQEHAWWMLLGCLLIVLIPIVGILLGGFRLLLDTITPKWLSWSLALLWFCALVPTIIGGLALAREYQRDGESTESVALETPSDNIMYLDALHAAQGDGKWRMRLNRNHFDLDADGLLIENDSIACECADLDVEASADSLYHLVIKRESRGRSGKQATASAARIKGEFRQVGDVLKVSPVIRYAREDKLRGQDIQYTLLVPVGSSVFFRPGAKHIIYDVDNVTRTRDKHMIGKAWTMTHKGLQEGMPGELVAPSDKAPTGTEPEDQKGKADANGIEASTQMPLRLPSLLGLLRLPV